jgi:hypothetical protein
MRLSLSLWIIALASLVFCGTAQEEEIRTKPITYAEALERQKNNPPQRPPLSPVQNTPKAFNSRSPQDVANLCNVWYRRQKREEEKRKASEQLVEWSKNCSCMEFSVIDAVNFTYNKAFKLANQLWSSTGAGEVLEQATTRFDEVKTLAVDTVAEKVDREQIMQTVMSHPLYQEHLAEHVDKLKTRADAMWISYEYHHFRHMKRKYNFHYYHTFLNPYNDYKNHINGQKDEWKKVINMAVANLTFPIYDMLGEMTRKCKVNPDWLPGTYDHTNERFQLDRKERRIYDGQEKVSWDRLFLLIVGALFAWTLLKVALQIVRIALGMVRVFFKLAWIVWRYFVRPPINFMIAFIEIYICVFTCFYCCGLCRRRKKAATLVDKSNKGGAEPKEASLAEVTELLEQAKKDKKLEPAAKQLASLAKKGTAMSAPKKMMGKKITKEVVTQAVAKFPELDIKNLKLS